MEINPSIMRYVPSSLVAGTGMKLARESMVIPTQLESYIKAMYGECVK